MRGIRVFISYSSKNREIARDVALEMMELGIDFFLDCMHIQPGEHWDRAIHLALYRSTHLVLIHTQDSFNSDNVWDEWSYFRDHKKPIIPLVFDTTELPFRLARVQYIDCIQLSRDGVLRKLLSILRHVETPKMPTSKLYISKSLDETQPAPQVIEQDDDDVSV